MMGRGAGGGGGVGRAGRTYGGRPMFAGAPAEHAALATDVVTGIDAARYETGVVEARGYYNVDRPGRIVLSTNPDLVMRGIDNHELGHLVWHEVLTRDQRNSLGAAYTRDARRLGGAFRIYYISPYGAQWSTEAWGEAYRYACEGRRGLRRVDRTMDPVFGQALREIGFR